MKKYISKLLVPSLFMTMIFFTRILIALDLNDQYFIKSVDSDEDITIQLRDEAPLLVVGDVLQIKSHQTGDYLGLVEVTEIGENKLEYFGKITQTEGQSLVREKNILTRVNFKNLDKEFAARFELEAKKNKPSFLKYRSLTYGGMSHGFFASNLHSGEVLMGPSMLAIGLHQNFQISSNLVSNLYKVYNLGLKVQLFDNQQATLAIDYQYLLFNGNKKGTNVVTFYYDNVLSSKFKNYTKIKIFTQKPQDQFLYNSSSYKENFNLEASVNYDYLTDRWGHVIVGPKYDAEKRKLGALVSYLQTFQDQTVSLLVGFSANDVTRFKLSKDGYILNFDMWWQF